MEHSVASEITAGTGKEQVDVFPIQRFDLSSAFLPNGKLDRRFYNFKKSGVPSRFLVLSEGSWVDLPHKVFEELKAGFLAGKTRLEIAVCEKSYLFDFLCMSRTDLNTRKWNSIAWIDVHGGCFFPVYEREHRRSEPLSSRIVKKDHIDYCRQKVSDENTEVSSNRWPDTKLLGDDDRFYKVVEKLFLSGMKRFIPDSIITSIHKCLHSSPSASSRLLSFQFQRRETMEARGNSNIKFGWYSSSSSNVSAILSDGFRQPKSAAQLGISNHGFGIHLSSPYTPHDSALLSEADENGERHLLLCRVIMGKSEKVEAGSIQDHPSNESFDTGVDDTVNPKWYVVWNTHMNTHIIPDFVVSFKSSGNPRVLKKPMAVQNLANLPFWKLFAEIGRCLPSSKMQALEIFYNQYKVGRISKDIFIRNMRSIAGDQLLSSTIRRLRVC